MNTTPIKKAVAKAGGQTELARLLSTKTKRIPQSTVSSWVERGIPPAGYWKRIEEKLGVPMKEFADFADKLAYSKKRASGGS